MEETDNYGLSMMLCKKRLIFEIFEIFVTTFEQFKIILSGHKIHVCNQVLFLRNYESKDKRYEFCFLRASRKDDFKVAQKVM